MPTPPEDVMAEQERRKLGLLLAELVTSRGGGRQLAGQIYDYQVATPAGPLAIHYSEIYGSILCQFERPADAQAAGVPNVQANGRCNFYFGRIKAASAIGQVAAMLDGMVDRRKARVSI